jgi:EmrB/QacA subfamily drug resistance transporter
MVRLTSGNRQRLILATMTGAMCMVLIDETVVSVALPTIQRDLLMSPSGAQWVVNAYLLALASCVAVGGRLGELLGQARMFRLGAVVFVAASAGCGLAGSGAWLIAARAVQGLGAAAMTPATGAIVINAFRAGERGRAGGTLSGISMISLALGPLLGGLLTQGITWRAVFWVNIPVGLAVLALARLSLPADASERSAAMDWPGAAMLVPGLVMIVLALMQAAQWGWASPATMALLGLGAALLVAFTLTEARRGSPLVQLKLFSSRNFSVGTAVLGCVQFALIGLTVFGAIYLQEILGFGPIAAGLALLPVVMPLLLLSPAAGRAYDRLGPRALVAAGAALLGAGLMWTATVLGTLRYAWLLPGLVVTGIGIALVMAPASTDVMNTAPRAWRGQASGVSQTLRHMGGTVGLALMATAVAGIQHARLTAFTAQTGARGASREHVTAVLAAAHGDPAMLNSLGAAALGALRDSLVAGIGGALYIGGTVVLAAAVAAWMLLRRVPPADARPAPATLATTRSASRAS